MTDTNPIQEAGRVIGRFFPEYRSRAELMARDDLNAVERLEIIAAGDAGGSARSLIKSVLARAYDRRQAEAAAAVPAELEKDRVQNEEVRRELTGTSDAQTVSNDDGAPSTPPPATDAPPMAEHAQSSEAAAPSSAAEPPAVAQPAPVAAAATETAPGGTVEEAAPVESLEA